MTDTILLVDDDDDVRDSLGDLLKSAGFAVRSYASGPSFLVDGLDKGGGCLVADIRMPGMDGLELHAFVARRNPGLPVIFITGHGDVPLAVRAMKAGAIDFIEKPFDDDVLLASIRNALAAGRVALDRAAAAIEADKRLSVLTPREREVFDHLVVGRANKIVAYELGISTRTVEVHRAHVMEKLRAASLSDLVRLSIASSGATRTVP